MQRACCAFGLNTTAFLEAGVAGRPCLTIVSDEFWASQGRTGHFQHLMEGHFLEVSADVSAAAARIARIVDGADETKADRLAFARWFLRPCGMDRPSAQVVVDVMERPARARPTATVRSTRGEIDLVPGLTLASAGARR